MEKSNEIVINGRRYDARTGQRLDAPAPAKSVKRESRRTVHQRQQAKHLKAHAPSSSRLLMRKAVAKPAHAKSRIKTQAVLTVQNPASELINVHRLSARLDRAEHIKRSGAVIHFSKASNTHEVKPAVVLTPAALAQPSVNAQTTDEFLEAALQAAIAHEQKPLPKPRTKRRLFGRTRAQAV